MGAPALAPPDVRQLELVVALVREVLGPAAVGGYLFGSAAAGGLRPRSDLDLLAVSARPTTAAERRRLVDRLLAVSGRQTAAGRARRVELTVVVASEVRPWRYPPRFDFQYGDWLRPEFERGDLEPWPTRVSPDLAVLLTMALAADATLFGPPAADVLAPVPHGDLVRAIVAGVEPLLDELDEDTGNVVLTLARIWSTLATGEIRSKDAAAEWALPRLPERHRPVLARARAVYLGEEDERWHDLADRVRPFADHAAGEIAAAQ